MTSPAQVRVTRSRSRDRSGRGAADLAAVVSVEPAPPGPTTALESAVDDESDRSA